MKLIELKLKNFRCYKNETILNVDDLTVIIGRNDSGKSALLDALDFFFNKGISKEDACVFNEDKSVEICCVFNDLPPSIVIDTQYPTDLASEYMLNADGNLEIIKKYNCNNAKPSESVYIKALHPSKPNYDKLLNMTITELKSKARELGVDLSTANQGISSQIRKTIWDHEINLDLIEQEIELKKGDAESIKNKIESELPVFALFKSDRASTDQDKEAQDPLNSAIKEAIRAQETALSEITNRVRQEVQRIADKTVDKIREMNSELANQLNPKVIPKKWESLFSVNITGDEDIPLNKRGSGTRRMVLLNFFRAKAEMDAESRRTGIIYAIEEPETSQHPTNQIMLINAFKELVEIHGNQVMITTHTPVLAKRFASACLRYVIQDNRNSNVINELNDAHLEQLTRNLGVHPDNNVKVFFGVEGPRDENFFYNISRILHQTELDIPDLEQEVKNGRLVIIPLGGSTLELWISRLQHLNRPEFYVFDRDYQPPASAHYENQANTINQRPSCTAWITNKKEIENYVHNSIIIADIPNYPGINDSFEDVPMLVAKTIHDNSSPNPWSTIDQHDKKEKINKAKKKINKDYSSRMTATLLSQIDTTDDIRTWLRAIGVALNER